MAEGALKPSHAAVLPGDAGPAPTEANPAPVSAEGEQPPERPDYKVYKSRPGLLSRLRAPDLSKLRERTKRKGPDRAPRGDKEKETRPPGERPLWRRVLKWVGIAALVWIPVSYTHLTLPTNREV